MKEKLNTKVKKATNNKGNNSNKLCKKSKEQGITLVALVVTIIILLILAGVTIRTVTGDNGLFRKSKEAVNRWKEAETNEVGMMGYLDSEWDNLINGATGESKIIVVDNFEKFSLTAVQKGSKATKNIDFNEEIKVDFDMLDIFSHLGYQLSGAKTLEELLVTVYNLANGIEETEEQIESFQQYLQLQVDDSMPQELKEAILNCKTLKEYCKIIAPDNADADAMYSGFLQEILDASFVILFKELGYSSFESLPEDLEIITPNGKPLESLFGACSFTVPYKQETYNFIFRSPKKEIIVPIEIGRYVGIHSLETIEKDGFTDTSRYYSAIDLENKSILKTNQARVSETKETWTDITEEWFEANGSYNHIGNRVEILAGIESGEFFINFITDQANFISYFNNKFLDLN